MLLEDTLDALDLVAGPDNEAVALGPHGFVLRSRELHGLQALVPAAFAQEVGLTVNFEAFVHLRDALVHLAEEAFVPNVAFLLRIQCRFQGRSAPGWGVLEILGASRAQSKTDTLR
jgi:hypothetical protein